MTRRGSRWLRVGLLAGASAGLLEMAAVLNPAVGVADDTALIMGYTETPNPLPSYVTEVMNLFVNPSEPFFDGQPTYPGYLPVVLPTEEGADYQQVLTLGAAQLDQGIRDHLTASGDHVVVYGYSESTSIASQEMINLSNLPADQQIDPASLQFILVENLNNPNGGFLERLPLLAGTEFPATPADTPYDTAIYTIEYSGSSDFPQYPLNLLADANAMAGFVNLHPFLLPGWPTSFDPASLAGATLQNTSPGYDGNTDYFMIPTQDLPLLDGIRALGGDAFADLIQPDLRVLIDLGYDRTGYADVVTPAQWTMPDIDWTTVSAELQLGWQQGMIAAQVDLGLLPTSDLPDMYPYLPDLPGLQSGSEPAAAAALATAGALGGDVSGSANLSGLLGDATTELSALFGSNAAADITSWLGTDFLSGLTSLLSNPLDFLNI